MRILFVAMAQSIHTARWIGQISDEGWDIHLFPSWDLTVHPKFRNLTIHGFKVRPHDLQKSVKLEGALLPVANPQNKNSFLHRVINSQRLAKLGVGKVLNRLKRKRHEILFEYTDESRCDELVRVIKKLKPDLIHSLEIQHAGYLTYNARKKIGAAFPKWIVTNWGADIHHFGEQPEHAGRIREVLEACDYYGCECQRDVLLGRKFGFAGEVLPVMTNTGGFNFDEIRQFRQPGKTSDRKLILLKGYQGWVYQALVGLQAVEKCADLFKERNYRLAVYLPSPGVPEAAKEMEQRTGIPVEIVPYTSHERILELHGHARVSIGLSLSDAISTSFLEAIVMGSFPVQSCTSCANEWVKNGESGYFVPPEDPDVIADALRIALIDDDLVDRAAEKNAETVRQRLDYRKVQQEVISIYKKIYQGEPLNE